MDINKLALELQQNQSVRQKIYAQYMKKSCLNIYNMLKNIKS